MVDVDGNGNQGKDEDKGQDEGHIDINIELISSGWLKLWYGHIFFMFSQSKHGTNIILAQSHQSQLIKPSPKTSTTNCQQMIALPG